MSPMTVKNRKKSRTGPRKLYTDRILLPLAPGVLERIDRVLRHEKETRVDVIRAGIERELAHRGYK